GLFGVFKSGTGRPNCSRSFPATGDWHDDLSAREQRDDPSCGEVARLGQPYGIFPLVVDHDWARHPVFARHRLRVAHVNCGARLDDQPQSVWEHLFHARWFSRAAPERRRCRDADCAWADNRAPVDNEGPRRRRAGFLVLALCGRRLGGGVYRGVRRRSIGAVNNVGDVFMLAHHDEFPPPDEPSDKGVVEMPRPTVAPLVVALGLVLLAAGTPLGLAFIIVGALLLMAGLGIWVSQLLPHRGHAIQPLAP